MLFSIFLTNPSLKTATEKTRLLEPTETDFAGQAAGYLCGLAVETEQDLILDGDNPDNSDGKLDLWAHLSEDRFSNQTRPRLHLFELPDKNTGILHFFQDGGIIIGHRKPSEARYEEPARFLPLPFRLRGYLPGFLSGQDAKIVIREADGGLTLTAHAARGGEERDVLSLLEKEAAEILQATDSFLVDLAPQLPSQKPENVVFFTPCWFPQDLVINDVQQDLLRRFVSDLHHAMAARHETMAHAQTKITLHPRLLERSTLRPETFIDIEIQGRDASGKSLYLSSYDAWKVMAQSILTNPDFPVPPDLQACVRMQRSRVDPNPHHPTRGTSLSPVALAASYADQEISLSAHERMAALSRFETEWLPYASKAGIHRLPLTEDGETQ